MSLDLIFKEIEEIKEEILGLKYAFILVNIEIIDSKMGEIFNTTNRRKIWIHFDDFLTQEEVGKLAGTTQKEVSRFIERYTKMGFLRIDENDVKHKIFNYTPKSWL